MFLAKCLGMIASLHIPPFARTCSILGLAAAMLLASLVAVGLGRPSVEISLRDLPLPSPIGATRPDVILGPTGSMRAEHVGTLTEPPEAARLLLQLVARPSTFPASIRLPESGVVPALLRRPVDCADRESYRQVIGALGPRGDRSATASLVARLKDPRLQKDSIRALGQSAGLEAVAPLVDCLLHHESPLARIEAARALRLIGGPLVKYSLCHAALDDRELAVRQAAFRAWMDLAGSGMRGGSASL